MTTESALVHNPSQRLNNIAKHSFVSPIQVTLFKHPKVTTPTSRTRTFPVCRRANWHDVIAPTRLSELRIGTLAVPRHLWNKRMRQKGVYRSVEYVIEGLILDDKPIESTRHVPPGRVDEIVARIRPSNRLLPRFERHWPVDVTIGEAKLWSYKTDLLSCVIATIFLACSFLSIGFIGPMYIGVYSIPSKSMMPTLRVGDALLVEKVSFPTKAPRRGEIILFRPPSRLARILRTEGDDQVVLRRNDLFIKRVAAISGDIIAVSRDGIRVNGFVVDKPVAGSPDVSPRKIPEGYLFVLGDNPDNSVDSRYWGLLPVEYVVGRPVARIFPLDRFDVHV